MTHPLPDDQLPPLPSTSSDVDSLPPVAPKIPSPPVAKDFPSSLTADSNTSTTPELTDSLLPTPPMSLNQSPTSPLEMPPEKPIIAPPEKNDVAPEAPFPGQPIPESEQEKLEEQAKKIIDSDGGLPPSKATKSKMVQGVLGALALVLVGAGVFFGQQLVNQGGVGDIRQQASLDDIPKEGASCPPTHPFEKDGFCYIIDPDGIAGDVTREVVDCPPDRGLTPGAVDGCTQYTNGQGQSVLCWPVNGGIFCGTLRGGTECAPIIGGGGDWCQVIGGPTALCSELGLSRCQCSNGVWIIGAGSCNEMCGGTNNICHNCNNPPEETPPPQTHLECVNDSCAYVAGGGTNECSTDADCDEPPGETLACTELSASDNTPTLGDSVTFTCSGTTTPGSINHYDFQYKVGTASEFQNLAAASTGSDESVPLTITEPGTYTVRCRACKSSDNTNCTSWQAL